MNATATTLHCNLCGANAERIARYHDQGYRRVVRCRDCGLVFVDPMPNPEEKADIEREAYEGELLPEVADFFRNCHRDFKDDAVIRGFRDALEWMTRTYGRPGKLLDVGPGTGIFLYLASTEFDWEPSGIDVCEESARKASEEFGLTLDVGDFERFGYESESFDAVAMLDVLEHSIDPTRFLARAYELLKPGGLLYIAVPNQRCLMTVLLDAWIRIGAPMRRFFMDRLYVAPHVYYFSPATLGRAVSKAGFEVVRIRGGNVYLGRYRLPLWMRVPMEVVLAAGSAVGMSAKTLALVRKPLEPRPS